MTLLARLLVGGSQQVPIFSAASGSMSVDADQNTDSVLATFKNDSITSILRKCDLKNFKS